MTSRAHRTCKLLLAVVASVAIGTAAAQAPSDASIDRLLTLMNAQSNVTNMQAAMDRMGQTMLQQSGVPATAQAQASHDRVMAIVREEMSWEKFKPKIMQVYRDTFTQEEIDGLIAFYESPAGRAYIAKVPVVAAKTMELAQQQMQLLLPKIKAAAEEARVQQGAPK